LAFAAAFLDLDFFAGGAGEDVVAVGDGIGAGVGESGRGERGERGESAGERVEEKGKLKLRVWGFSLTTRWRPAGKAPPANSLRLSPARTTRSVESSDLCVLSQPNPQQLHKLYTCKPGKFDGIRVNNPKS
jgi:hypothetical protein